MLKNYRNNKLLKFATALSISLLSLASVTICSANEDLSSEKEDTTCSFYNEDGTVELLRLKTDLKSADSQIAFSKALIDLVTSKSELETRKILLNFCTTLVHSTENLPVEKCRLTYSSNVHLWATWQKTTYELVIFGNLSYQPAETRTVSTGCNPQYLGGPCSVSSGQTQKISEETCSVTASARKLTKPSRKMKF
jgi:hypothetical protein